MDDLISRQAALDFIKDHSYPVRHFGEGKEKMSYVECVMSGVPESEIVRLQKGTAKNAD